MKFYEAVFQVTLRRENIGGDLAVFPGGEDSVNGAVVSQEGYVPAANGAVVYLNTGDNLQPYLDRDRSNGGTVICRRRHCRRAWVTMRTSAIPKAIASACSRRTDHGPARTTAANESQTATRYWVGVASRDHVARGVAGGSASSVTARPALPPHAARRLIVYYSPKERLDGEALCQQFTAIGQVSGDGVYVFEMAPRFAPSA